MAVARGSLDAHRPACGDEAIERLRAAAEPLRGARVVHVSPAGAGGRVPELLKSMLPLAADLDLEIEWQVLFGDRELQAVAHSLTRRHPGRRGRHRRCRLRGLSRGLCPRHPGPGRRRPAGPARRRHPRAGTGGPRPGAVAVPRGRLAAGRTFARAGRAAHGGMRGPGIPAESFAPDRPEAPVPAAATGNRSARPPQPGAGGSPGRAGGAPAGSGPVAAVRCQVMRFDRWKDHTRRSRPLGWPARSCPRSSWSWRARSRTPTPTAGGFCARSRTTPRATTTSCCSRATREWAAGAGRAAVPRARCAAALRSARASAWPPSEALWKGTPVVGGTQGGLPLQVRDGVDGYLTDDVGAGSVPDRRARAGSGSRHRDGRVGARAGARALPGDARFWRTSWP